MNKYFERVTAIRELMSEKGWDAVVITASDPHSSEYPALRWKQVEWISGFGGEAGDMVITQDHAGLWTDTRYFIQAEQVLPGTGIELHKTRVPEQVLIPEWLADEAFPDEEEKIVVAIDGQAQSADSVEEIKEALTAGGRNEEDIVIVDASDFLDELWENRPGIPQTPIITLGYDLTGAGREEKIQRIREFLVAQNADAILISTLDDIAWTLNVRGSDIDYNPVVISYLVVTSNDVNWYVKKNSFQPDEETEASFDELSKDGINILYYSQIELDLCEYDNNEAAVLLVDKITLNYHLAKLLKTSPWTLVNCKSPVPLMKAIKNQTEIEGMREAHLEDGIAMERFLYWLDTQVSMSSGITEWDAAEKLGEFRSEIPGYRGDSFETISAYGKGAALPHYVTPKRLAPTLLRQSLYLCDSGGQYLFGTTDITRTVALGPCSQLEKEDYTLVLKGHIALASAVFPKGTAGCQLDVLARNALWQSKRNFGHGTGHGVGYFLNVHEGPQDIRQNFNSQPLLPGMITSDEPGIYREGQHGVRHESLLLTVEAGTNDFGTWLKFENLTLCHIDTAPINISLLTKAEINWINDYNKHVYDVLSPRLPDEVSLWLKEKTAKIGSE